MKLRRLLFAQVNVDLFQRWRPFFVGVRRQLGYADRESRREIWRAVEARVPGGFGRDFFEIFFFVFAIAGAWEWIRGPAWVWPKLILLSWAAIAFAHTSGLSARTRFRNALHEELLLRGIPVCRACGYNLTGLVSQRCPECGAEVPSAALRGGRAAV